MPTPVRYGTVAILLHWFTAAAIVALLVLGTLMGEAKRGSPLQFSLFQWHKSIGITVLLLSVARLVWRLSHPPPALPATMPVWQRRAAKASHLLFYVFLIGVPLGGWATVSASPYNIPTVLYGMIPWPHLPILPTLPNKAALEDVLGDAHATAAWMLAGLAALHAVAAFHHHLRLKDDVLRRMVPFLADSGAKR